MAVVIETTLGDITVDLYVEERPQTCKNFLKLCKIKYYNFCLFHSIQANFIAQTGDPTGTGTGGESVFGLVYGPDSKYYEAEKMPKIKHSKPGLLSMVNCGNNMLGSQFFVTLGADLQSLEEHCVFAEVTEGHDILIKLNDAICDTQHRPYQDIRITHTVILDDPFEDVPGLLIPPSSPEISHANLYNGRIGADEKINDEEGLTEAQLLEIKAEREAKARATILEIVGDLPDAEVAPPENVLFVCKLNPVTTDEDLEIIFSRFGKVKSCEVIRDHSSGDSLQYAFVEFEDQKSCEQAYLKMDNVLIDDRRIHVDFSQSVSKIKWKGKGRGVQYLDKNDKETSRSSDRYSSKRDHYRDRERDRDRDRRRDDRRRREDDYRRRDRNDGRRKEDSWRDERIEEDRKRRELREERRKEEERKYYLERRDKRDDKRDRNDKRHETSKRDSDKRRNGTDRKENEKRPERKEIHKTENHKPPKEDPPKIEVPVKVEKPTEPVNNVRHSPEIQSNEVASFSENNVSQSSSSPAKTESKSVSLERKKKRRRHESTSSASSSSGSSISSSSSTSVEKKKRSKSSMTVAKKYYHRGKLVKVVKEKKKRSSDSESFSESSDSDRRKRKSKYKKVVKVIKKRRRSSDSESDSSSSDDSDESRRRRKRKKHKHDKKKRKENMKKNKKKKVHESEDSSVSDADEKCRKKGKTV